MWLEGKEQVKRLESCATARAMRHCQTALCRRNQARENGNGRGRSRNSGTRQGGTLCREADAVKEWLVNYLNRSKHEKTAVYIFPHAQNTLQFLFCDLLTL